MNKNINTSSLKDTVLDLKDYTVKHRIIIFIIFAAFVLGFLFIRIATMANSEPTSQQQSEAKIVEAVKLDEKSILVIQQLEDKNIDVEALFVPGRYDPFNN